MADKKNFTYRLKSYLLDPRKDNPSEDISNVSSKFLLDGVKIYKDDNLKSKDIKRLLMFNHLYNNVYGGFQTNILEETRNLINHISTDFNTKNTMFKPVYKTKTTDADKIINEYVQRDEIDSYQVNSIKASLKFDNDKLSEEKSIYFSQKSKLKKKSSKKKVSTAAVNLSDTSLITVKALTEAIESKKIGKCNSCPLKDETRIVGFGSNVENVKDIEVLLIGEAPAMNEVEQHKPFIGKSGQLIREVIDRNKYINVKYGIINSVICFHKAGNKPTQEEISFCKPNLEFVINSLPNLKKIITIGAVPTSEFLDNPDIKITKLHGKDITSMVKFKIPQNVRVYAMFHPSYALRRGAKNIKAFQDTLRHILTTDAVSSESMYLEQSYNEVDNIGDNIQRVSSLDEIIRIMNSKEKAYTLVDVQKRANRVKVGVDKYMTQFSLLFIFRGESKNKYMFYIEDPRFTFWYSNQENDIAVRRAKDLIKVDCSYSIRKSAFLMDHKKHGYQDKSAEDYTLYQYNYDLASFYSNQYYRRTDTKENDQIPLRISIVDIELYVDPSVEMDQKDMRHSLVCYTIYDNYLDKYVFAYNKDFLTIDKDHILSHYEDLNLEIVEFKDEITLIEYYIKFIHETNPDIITNWNVLFDIESLYTRYYNLTGKHIDINGIPIINSEKYGIREFPGIVIVDYLDIYKSNDFTKKSTYALDAIATIELNEGKIDFTGSLNDLIKADPTLFSIYNINDVKLVNAIDQKRKLISMTNTLKKVSASTWYAAKKYIGIALIDSTIIFRANNQGLVIADVKDSVGDKYEGAFVLQPAQKFNEWLVVYDLASLYPHVMSRYNLERSTYVMKIPRDIAYEYIHKRNILFSKKDSEVEVVFYPNTYKEIHKQLSIEQLLEFIEKNKLIITINGTCMLPHSKKKSIIYQVIDELYTKRIFHKNKVKETNGIEREINDLYQYTYKILMNAIYGVQGNANFRLYDRDLAETITLSAKEVAKFSAVHVHKYLEKMKHKDFSFDVEIDNEFFIKEEMNNVQYMDTDSVFVVFKEFADKNKSISENLGLLKPYYDKTLEFFNEHLLKLLIKRHNLDPSDNIFNFNFKIEYIVRRSIMPAKKTYALWIVFDGKEVDKLKFKGLSTVRSDYSVWTKTTLTELIDLILRQNITDNRTRLEDWILSKYSEMKKLLSEGSFDVARPLSLSKPLELYKTATESVKGALFWNTFIYNHFKNFGKGYHFYITDINPTNLLTISSTVKTVDEYYSAIEDYKSRLKIYVSNQTTKALNDFEKKFKLDSILVPLEPNADEVNLTELPPSIFTIDTDKMILTGFINRIRDFVEPIVDLSDLLHLKRPKQTKAKQGIAITL